MDVLSTGRFDHLMRFADLDFELRSEALTCYELLLANPQVNWSVLTDRTLTLALIYAVEKAPGFADAVGDYMDAADKRHTLLGD